MKISKRRILILIAFAVIAYYWKISNQQIRLRKELTIPDAPLSESSPPKTDISLVQTQTKTENNAIQNKKTHSKPIIPIDKFSKQKSIRTFEGTPHPALPRNFQIAKGVYSISDKNYRKSMGEIIEKKNGNIFFKTENYMPEFANVVVDNKNGRIYSLSSVIKVTNVNEDLRRELLSNGYEEQYYHEYLKVMYIQSSHEELFKIYNELKELQFSPEIEILRGSHRLK